jgi:ribonucleoside-diphosphate reductase beta chain
LKTPNILKKQDAYVFDYPTAITFADRQMDIFWHPNEIEVEKDVQDFRVNFTEAEKHGVTTTLKLFTLYELSVGNEYWNGKIVKNFSRPEIVRMANCFSFFELNVHAPFYNKLNEALGLDTEEFYTSYVDDPVLNERMKWIDSVVSDKDLALSVAVFSLIEGAILYSNFAFLKHFQAEGKNKLVNVTAGINFSVKDENTHSEAGAWLYKTLMAEGYEGNYSIEERNNKILEAANNVYEHECRIIDMIFEVGDIKGITALQLKNFVQSRIDLCLTNLGFDKMFNPKYNPIDKWFYKNINSSQFHDFFVKVGNEYNRDWTETEFKWNTAPKAKTEIKTTKIVSDNLASFFKE